MNGKEVNVLANGEGRKFMLVFKGNIQAYLPRQEQCKTAKHLLPHLVIGGYCTNQIVLICSGYSDQSECKRRARARGQDACPIRAELARARVMHYVTVDNKSLRLHLSAREHSQHKSKMSAMFRGCAAPGLRIF